MFYSHSLRTAALGVSLLLATTPRTSIAQQVSGFISSPGYTASTLGLVGSAFAFSPDGKFALAQDDFGGNATVTVFDRVGTGRTVLKTFQAPSGTSWQFLTGLAWQDSNTLVIGENGSAKTVFSASLGSGAVTTLAPVNSLPNIAQIAIASNGTLFAGLANGPGANAVVTIANNTVNPFVSNIGTGYLGGLAFRPTDGALFIGDSNDPFFSGNAGQALQLNPDGSVANAFSLAGGGGSGIYDLAFSPNGDLFATTGKTLTLLPSGQNTALNFGTFTDAFPFPTELAFTGDGFAPFSGGGGRLFVNGVFTGVGDLFVIQPAAVPETSGWAILLIGVGMLGMARLRRKAAATVCLCVVAAVPASAQFATKVWAYDSTGAASGYTDASRALGAPSTKATPAVPDNSAVVSFGQAGYLVLGFDVPVKRNHARQDRLDFIVFGNAFYVGGNTHLRFQEPALVEVGLDLNGNGYDASDPFYLLKGSANPKSGAPLQGIDDRTATTWGYADVTPTNGLGDPFLPDDRFASGLTTGSAGGDAFSLEWAVDTQGNAVTLEQADFVRFRAAGNWNSEIDAVSLLPDRGTRQRSDPNFTKGDTVFYPGGPRQFGALSRAASVPEPGAVLYGLSGTFMVFWSILRRLRG